MAHLLITARYQNVPIRNLGQDWKGVHDAESRTQLADAAGLTISEVGVLPLKDWKPQPHNIAINAQSDRVSFDIAIQVLGAVDDKVLATAKNHDAQFQLMADEFIAQNDIASIIAGAGGSITSLEELLTPPNPTPTVAT
jgi:hypothetical protein